MTIVRWSKAAVADLADIHGWLIREASRPIARRLLSHIRVQAEVLESFPAIGTVIGEAERKLRVRGTNYVILYRPGRESVEVLRVHHNRRDWIPR